MFVFTFLSSRLYSEESYQISFKLIQLSEDTGSTIGNMWLRSILQAFVLRYSNIITQIFSRQLFHLLSKFSRKFHNAFNSEFLPFALHAFVSSLPPRSKVVWQLFVAAENVDVFNTFTTTLVLQPLTVTVAAAVLRLMAVVCCYIHYR